MSGRDADTTRPASLAPLAHPATGFQLRPFRSVRNLSAIVN